MRTLIYQDLYRGSLTIEGHSHDVTASLQLQLTMCARMYVDFMFAEGNNTAF